MNAGAIAALESRIARLEAVLTPRDMPVGMIDLGCDSRVQDVVKFVSFHTGVPATVINGPFRGIAPFRARAAVAWAAVRLLGKNSTVVARSMGDRDHTSILHAVRRAECDFMVADPAFRLLCGRLRAAFEASE